MILVGGWISKSIYSIIRVIRGVAQIISYEIVLIFLIFIFLYRVEGLSVRICKDFQEEYSFVWEMYLLVIRGIIIILCELNRTPFDLLEGESELVSGYNVEFGGGKFGLFFIIENLMIIFWSILLIYLFIGLGRIFRWLLKIFLIIYIFVWIRIVFPRYRYDKVIELMWENILLFYIFILIYIYGIKFVYYCYLY